MINSREIRDAIREVAEQIARAADESAHIYEDTTGDVALHNFALTIRKTNALINGIQLYQ